MARKLRNSSTLSEVLLWRHIKNKQILGYRFLKQKPVDSYILDFFSPELMIAIEIDGETHNYRIDSDRVRQRRLEALGIKVLRFLDADIKNNMEGVLNEIERCVGELAKRKQHPPGPPQGGLKLTP